MSLTTEQQAQIRDSFAGRGLGGFGGGGYGLPNANTTRAPGTVDVSAMPAGSAASYTGADWNKFMTDYGPLIEKQLASLNSEDMVKQAEKDAALAPGLMAGAMNRAVNRRGGVNATQMAAMSAGQQIGAATGTADMLNNARIDQRTRNTDSALKLSGLGTDIYQMGLDNVRESEGLAAQRKINNTQSKAAYKSNVLGGAMTLSAVAAMAFL